MNWNAQISIFSKCCVITLHDAISGMFVDDGPTTKGRHMLAEARAWCLDHGFQYDEVQEDF